MMNSSLTQELYKLWHQKVTWITPILMIFFMIFMGFAMGKSYSQLLIMTAYNSSQWIMLILVIIGSTMFSTEFQNNTILTLLYKTSHKYNIYFTKLIIIFIYNVFLHVMALLITVVLKLTKLNAPVSWFSIYRYHQPLLVNMFLTSIIDIFTSMLIISFVFLMSCLIKSNSVVITVNIGIIIMGPAITTNLIRWNPSWVSIIKWNPFNMTNLTQQYFNFKSYHPTTLLSNGQLMAGTIVYTLLFLIVGYVIFKKKHF